MPPQLLTFRCPVSRTYHDACSDQLESSPDPPHDTGPAARRPLAADDREHAGDARRTPQRWVHVVAATALTPPQQFLRQPLAQRLVEVAARTRAVAQTVVNGLADAVQRVQRRDALQRLPGVADTALKTASSSGGSSPR